MPIEVRRSDIQAELRRRQDSSAHPDILAGTFPEQRACILDTSPLKVEFCTRRAAKTFTWGLEAIYDSFTHPGAKYLFLGLVRQEAKRIFWTDVLKAINERYRLGMTFNESELTASMPNGAVIFIGAADANEQEMRKLFGQKYRKVGVDEAQEWTHTDLHALVYEVLKPACADRRGSITLMGTPGRFLKSFFRQLTPVSVVAGIAGAKGTFPGWSLHCWDTSANTSVIDGKRMCDNWAAEIAELRATHPGIEETPSFRRNYQGEWVVQDDLLVYRYQPGRNDFTALPAPRKGRLHYVLGIDLGWSDASAFVLSAYHDFDPCLYELETFKRSGMDLTDVARKVKEYGKRFDIDANVIDGANKQAVMELMQRHDLSLICADKTGKADFIELMNAEYTMGRIKLNPKTCADLVAEYGGLVWNDKSEKREEHPACENHLADAALYAWRHCYQYLSKPLKPLPPKPGTPDYLAVLSQRLAEEAQREEEADVERDERRRRDPYEADEEWKFGD